MQPHLGHLYRVAYRLTNNPDAAEDLVQDIMLHFYPKLAELRQIDNLRPWLARSLYNRFIDNIRRDKRNPITSAANEDAMAIMPDLEAEPEREMEQDLLQVRLNDALNTLNEDQRHVVMLHDMEGYTLTELAQVLDTPLGTLKSRLHRARNSLKEQLAMEPSDTLLRIRD